jgi:signal peptidase I
MDLYAVEACLNGVPSSTSKVIDNRGDLVYLKPPRLGVHHAALGVVPPIGLWRYLLIRAGDRRLAIRLVIYFEQRRDD